MTKPKRQIIALGGGGFSMEPDNLTLDRYILEQANRERPEVCLLATAIGDSDRARASFYAAHAQLECRASHLSFFDRTPDDLRTFVLSKDVIYVGGGNTKSMLAVWKEWELPTILREAWAAGVVLAGVSAGAICWFEQGITDSVAGKLGPLDCLGFLPGSCCPHYDGEAERRPSYHRMLLEGKVQSGYALDDGAALHFVDEEPHMVVTSRPNAKAYRVSVEAGEVQEEVISL